MLRKYNRDNFKSSPLTLGLKISLTIFSESLAFPVFAVFKTSSNSFIEISGLLFSEPVKVSSVHFSFCIVSFSKHRPSGPMLSKSRNVCLSVCLSVRPCVCSLLRYHLTVFLPSLPEVGCPIFLEIRNPWGKVMERSGLTFEHLCLEVV